MDACAICTSALSGEGFSADEGGRSTSRGSVPQPGSTSVASNASAPSGDRMNAGILKEIVMKRRLVCALLSLCLPWSAYAALDIGDAAPDFTTPAALGGKVYQFS